MAPGKLVIVRHGETFSNLERKYSGWYETELTEKGMREMESAADSIKREGIKFDIAYSSVLNRSIRSMWILLDKLDQTYVPTSVSWRINECHFGGFTGLKGPEIIQAYGKDAVVNLKTKFSFRPPPMKGSPDPADAPKYKALDQSIVPRSESIEDMWGRARPFWTDTIFQSLRSGKTVLWVIHGNVLRALMKELEGLTPEDTMNQNVVANGCPLVLEFDENMNLINKKMLGEDGRRVYLSDGIV